MFGKKSEDELAGNIGALEEKQDIIRPHSIYVIGGVSLLFGPLSSAILAYISLKRFKSEYAKYVIPVSILYTIIIISISIFFDNPDSDTVKWFIRSLNLGLAFGLYFPFVMKWEKQHPGKKCSNKMSFKDIGWSILGLLAYVIIAFVMAFIFIVSGIIEV